MTRKSFELLATITKPIGLKGAVGAISADGLDLSEAEGLAVWVVPPPEGGARHLQISAVAWQSGGYQLHFTDVENLNQLGAISGCSLLADVDAVAALKVEQEEPAYLGKRIRDLRYGELGSIVDSYETAAYTMWVVVGAYGELLLPAVEDYLIREEGDLIELKLPVGMVEAQGGRSDIKEGSDVED